MEAGVWWIPQGSGWLFAGCLSLSLSLHGLPYSSMLLNHTNPKLSAVELKLALLWSAPLALELNFAYSYHLIQSLSPSFRSLQPITPSSFSCKISPFAAMWQRLGEWLPLNSWYMGMRRCSHVYWIYYVSDRFSQSLAVTLVHCYTLSLSVFDSHIL